MDLELFYLKQLTDSVPDYLFWKDTNSVFLGCNKNFAGLAGLSHTSEIIGKTDCDLPWGGAEGGAYRADDIEVMRSKQGKFNIEETQTKGVKKSYLLTSKVPLLNQNGEVSGIIGIFSDITERKQMEQDLLIAKEKAEAANRAKTEFLANMSHDVKTPMTGVVGVAEIMMNDSGWCTPEKAGMIHAAGLQVLNFFNNCLELSKLEMSAFSASEKQFSLKTILEEIYDLFLPRALSKNLQLTIDYDNSLPLNVLGYRESLYRVILNLVGNALKFTEIGKVQISIFLSEKIDNETMRVAIEIKDTGIGIPEDKHKEIFEKLKRLTPSYQDKTEGSGIGLYIVDQYVKSMNGTIHVESQVGQGSRFTVNIPLKIATLNESNASVVTPQKNADQILKQKTSRVLLVEDNPLAQMVTKKILESMKLQVDIAGTGEDAVAMFEPGKYDLVYMDIGLPGIDGYQTTQAIREKEKSLTTQTPIIALTGHGAIDVKTFCGEAGMQGVLSKPLLQEQAEKIWRRYGKHEATEVPGLLVLS